jgi:hypothetical protein
LGHQPIKDVIKLSNAQTFFLHKLTCYNKEIRKAKRSSWRRYCQEINDVPRSARLMMIMAEQAINRVSTIKLPDGQYTNWKGDTERVIESSFY